MFLGDPTEERRMREEGRGGVAENNEYLALIVN